MTNLRGSRHVEMQSCVHQCQVRQLEFHVKHKHTATAFSLYCMCTTQNSETETLPSLSLSFSTHFSHLSGAEKCPLLWTHLQFSALTPAPLSPLIPPPFFTGTGRLSVSVNPCNSFIYFIIFWSPFVLAVFLVIISCNLFAWHTSEKMGRVKYKTLITMEGEGERENVCVHVKGCNLVQLNCLYSDCTVSQNDCI